MADPKHQQLNERQKALQKALQRPEDHPELVDLFMAQHAALHAAEVSGTSEWSLDEELWDGLSEARARQVSGEHSIA